VSGDRGGRLHVPQKAHACPKANWAGTMDRAQRVEPALGLMQTRLAALLHRALPLMGVLALLVLWHLISLAYPEFILPGPMRVAQRWLERIEDGTLLPNALTTLGESALGLLMGSVCALVLGYPIASSQIAERMLKPLVIASQGIPFVAVAPLIFIWFGNGLAAKVLLCALVVFFPILVNVVAGLRGVPPTWRDLFRVHRATRWQTFAHLELPAALPHVLAGLRIGGTLSVIGAIAAEFVSANRGLGFFISQASNLYDTPSVMAGILSVMTLALVFYAAIGVLARVAAPQQSS
jgi:NitT/TauT family transport system permease protein